MKIEVRHVRGVAILEPHGKITIGTGDIQLRDAVLDSLEAGALNILLDFQYVSTIDSSGIGEMVSAYTTVTNRRGKLKLLKLSPKVLDVLQITELITVFDVYEDEDEAVDSFS